MTSRNEALIAAVRTAHAYMTYSAPSPLQIGIAAALEEEDGTFGGVQEIFHDNAVRLAAALRHIGFKVYTPSGGYFVIGDCSEIKIDSIGKMNDTKCCKWLIETYSVSAVPVSIFLLGKAGEAQQDNCCTLVRFAICKEKTEIEKAVAFLMKE